MTPDEIQQTKMKL